MKRTLTIVVALALVTLVTAGGLNAQTRTTYFVSGGLAAPLNSGFKSSYKTGWNLQGGLQFGGPTWPVAIRLDGLYGQNSLKNPPAGTSGKLKLTAGTANAVFEVKAPGKITPYVLGGLGLSQLKYDSTAASITTTVSTTRFLLDGGLGVKAGLSMLDLGVEGRVFSILTSGSSTTFVTLNLVVGFGGRSGF